MNKRATPHVNSLFYVRDVYTNHCIEIFTSAYKAKKCAREMGFTEHNTPIAYVACDYIAYLDGHRNFLKGVYYIPRKTLNLGIV